MFSLRLMCPSELSEYVSADLWEEGTCGIRESEGEQGTELIAGFALEAEAAQARARELMARFAKWNPQWEEEPETDWVEMTKESWPPREVGETWFVAAPWNEEPTPAGRTRLVQNPGLACGTGDHPCTQLALAAVAATVRPGDTVADIGSGSAILAVASLLAGARLVAAVDPDEAVVSAARENLALNLRRDEQARCLVVTGSADCLRSETFDVTVANISSTIVLMLAKELLRITKPGGWLILTGFSSDESCAFNGLMEGPQEATLGGWCCLFGKIPGNASGAG